MNVFEEPKSMRLKIIALTYGLGSWIAITGFWVELPILIIRLPEGWRLAAYLNVMIQAANIGPLIYYFLRRWNWCSEVMAVHIQMVLGVLSCILLITHWNYTVYIFGEQRSLILFIAAFGLSLVDCTSSVTFLPFMSRFRNCYLTPYLIGEGLSGFIPTIVALLQGVEDSENECSQDSALNLTLHSSNSINNTSQEPTLRFGAEVFFASLLVTLIISWISFIYLLLSPVAKREQHYCEQRHHEMRNSEENTICLRTKKRKQESGVISVSKCECDYKCEDFCSTIPVTLNNVFEERMTSKHLKYTSTKQFWCLQALMGFCCLTTFGIMPPLQPYSSLPFGNTTLHFTVVFAGLSYPFGCFLAMVTQSQRLRCQQFMYILTAIGTLIAIYVIIAASMSPIPPFLRSNKYFGSVIIVCSWTAFTVILSYVKTVVTQILNDKGGNEALFWVGMFTQIGSAVGAAFMFIAVDYWKWFKDECNH